VIAVIAWSAAAALGEELSPLEQLGRRIYLQGQGDGSIEALVGSGEMPIAAAVVPCASCHGADGRGRPEGGVIPPDITRTMLSTARDAGVSRARERGPYTGRLIKRAISMGIDASGNRLDATMPRYRMSSKNMDALMAYLEKVGEIPDPGVTADAVRIGVLLPPKAQLPGVREAVRKALQSFVDERNRAGRIYDRKIELVFAEVEGTPSERGAGGAKFVVDEKPFALVGSFTDGADEELATVAEEQRIPLLATISSHARSDSSRRYVRDLVAGLHDQTRALAQFIGRNHPKARVAVLYGSEDGSKSIAEAGAGELRKIGVTATLAATSVLPRALKDDGVEVVLYAGTPDALAGLAVATRELGWSLAVFAPSALIHPIALDRSRTSARFHIALPMGPDDQRPEAVNAWKKLVGEDGARHQPSQFAALASAQLLVAGLERAGRELSRENFLAAIDGVIALETGLVPPLTYTPSRHIGSTGAYVVSISGEERDVVWIDPG
jgi:ABC-type branched-subunit amino acid transport system substrate-binding protein